MNRIKSYIIDLLFFLVIMLIIHSFCSTDSDSEIETKNIIENSYIIKMKRLYLYRCGIKI